MGSTMPAEDETYMDYTMLPLVEDFYTLQGEGRFTGQAAYFIRLGGCDVGCAWCDAKFTWSAANFDLTPVDRIVERATEHPARNIVITGGEPTLYDLRQLTELLRERGMRIFIETSGTNPLVGWFDWVCLSPKRQQLPMDENFKRADELKVIISSVDDLFFAEQCATRVKSECLLYLQPEWSVRAQMMPRVIEYAMQNPKWRISLQAHKYMGIA